MRGCHGTKKRYVLHATSKSVVQTVGDQTPSAATEIAKWVEEPCPGCYHCEGPQRFDIDVPFDAPAPAEEGEWVRFDDMRALLEELGQTYQTIAAVRGLAKALQDLEHLPPKLRMLCGEGVVDTIVHVTEEALGLLDSE